MKLSTFIYIFLFIAVNIVKVYSHVYFLAPDGSDSGDGSIKSPWFSLNYALNKYANDNTRSRVGPGDTLYLRNGVYDVTRMSKMSTKSCPYIIPNTDINSKRIVVKSYLGEWAIFDGGNDREMMGTNVMVYNIDFDSFEVRNCKTVGIKFGDGWGSRYLTNCNFRHLYIHDNINSDVNANPSGMWLSGNNCIVEYCTFENNGTPGSSHHNSSNLLLFGNYNDWPEDRPTRNIIIRYNEFIGSASGLKDKGDGNFVNPSDPSENHPEYYTEIHHNIFRGSLTSACYLDQDFEKFHHNLFVDCDKGVMIHGQIDHADKTMWYIEIYNNTFVNTNELDVYVQPSAIGEDIGYHHQVYNNLFSKYNGGYAINFFSGQEKKWSMEADHNLFDDSDQYVSKYANDGRLTLSGWQELGFGIGSMQTKVQLLEDYTLVEESPAISNGRDGVDIGAFVYGEDSWITRVGYGAPIIKHLKKPINLKLKK